MKTKQAVAIIGASGQMDSLLPLAISISRKLIIHHKN
jgi:hypothetical protein